MKSVLLAILICVVPFITQASHTLPQKVEWKTNKILENEIILKSTSQLKEWQVKKIYQTYQNIEYLFFNIFENISCNKLDNLEIRIVSSDVLRDRRYFANASPRNFGRYFATSNTIYVIYEVFDCPDYLAHELAHYFYDECNIKFKDDIAEHIKVYGFQDFYREKIHGRQ
jgi:hypothetical protein